jgi:hypothetical protein
MSSNLSNRNPIKARFTSGPRPCRLVQREARANLLSCNEKQQIIPRPSPLLDLPHELIKMIMIHVDDSSIIAIRSACTLLKDETKDRFLALYFTRIEIKMSKKSLQVIAIRSICTLLKVETEDRLRALYFTDHKQHSILATCCEMRDDALLLFWAKTILRFDNEVALKGFVSPPWNPNLLRLQYSPEKTQHCTKPMKSSDEGPENCSTSHDGDVYHKVPHQRSFRVRAEQRSRFDLFSCSR